MPRILTAYLLAVAVAGLGALAALLAGGQLAEVLAAPGVFALLAVCVLVGEFLPITVPGHDDEVTTSTTFILAILAIFGLGPAAMVQALASVGADLAARKRPLSVAFNAGQRTVALGAAALVLQSFGASPALGDAVAVGPADLAAMLAAGVTFFAVNNLLAGTAWALFKRSPVLVALRDELPFQALTAVLLLGYAPVVVAVAAAGPLLVPLLLLPIQGIRGGRAAQLNEHHALHDRLTDLPNRVLFRERTERALAAARRDGSSLAVLVIDLDGFKAVNDTLGHHHGDELLKAVGPRLRKPLRAADTLARMGGDEFAVLLPDVGDPTAAERVARAMLEALCRPLSLGGITHEVAASVGVACFPGDGADVDALLRRADAAMYAAKALRSGTAVAGAPAVAP